MDYKYELKKINETIDSLSGRFDMSIFLSDIFELMAIEISNSFDDKQNEKRSKRQTEILNNYEKEEKDLISQIKESIYSLILQETEDVEFHDVLGDIYMMSYTSSKTKGQFFTPYNLSILNANLVSQCFETKRDEYGIITINEPSCGSGGQLIAAVECLNKKGINYATDCFFVAEDIDKRCVCMAFVQLSLLGVPAIIIRHNSLTNNSISDVWYTPSLLMQYLKFRERIKNVIFNNKNRP